MGRSDGSAGAPWWAPGTRAGARSPRRPVSWRPGRPVRVRDARRAVRAAAVRRPGAARPAILDLVAEGQPWNGYQIIQEIGARTEGVWRPSAGSVYPALQQLEDEALIKTEADEDRRRMYTLTEEGQAYVAEHADELKASWDAVTGSVDDAEVQLRSMIGQVMVAVSQVSQAGSAAQVAQAGKILADTRRALYRILASDGEEAGEDTRG